MKKLSSKQKSSSLTDITFQKCAIPLTSLTHVSKALTKLRPEQPNTKFVSRVKNSDKITKLSFILITKMLPKKDFFLKYIMALLFKIVIGSLF